MLLGLLGVSVSASRWALNALLLNEFTAVEDGFKLLQKKQQKNLQGPCQQPLNFSVNLLPHPYQTIFYQLPSFLIVKEFYVSFQRRKTNR